MSQTRSFMQIRRARPPARAAAIAAACVTAVVVALAGCAGHHGSSRSGTAGARPGTAVVVRDIDGDTIDVRLDGRVERLRLLGIDTPETKDPRKPVQCYGKEASAQTAALLPKGTTVHLERDVEVRDKYGRLLVYVYRSADQLFVNRQLVADGFAVLYTYPPNVAHVDELRAAADHARAANLGLWARCGGPGKPAQ